MCSNRQMSHGMTKPTKWVHPAKTQIGLGIRPIWSESSLSAWIKLESLATHWAHSNKVSVRPAKTQISLGIRPIWSESLLSAWRKLRSLATHWAHSEYSDQSGRMPRLIWSSLGAQPFCWFCQEAAHIISPDACSHNSHQVRIQLDSNPGFNRLDFPTFLKAYIHDHFLVYFSCTIKMTKK